LTNPTGDSIQPARRRDPLGAVRSAAPRAGIFLDFDGTLAPIVPHPEAARLVTGARPVLRRVAAAYGLVAVVSGRPTDDLKPRIGVPGVECVGLYGLDATPPTSALRDAVPQAALIADPIPGVWVEDKGATVAVHYRQAANRAAARAVLRVQLEEVAASSALVLGEGKMVFELFAAGALGKGTVVQHMALRHGLEALMVAGDDLADLDSFHAARRLRTGGRSAVTVAVTGPESPASLLREADVKVEGPIGLVELLRGLLSG
jgi:trehalose 6-phosphate phosphatase